MRGTPRRPARLVVLIAVLGTVGACFWGGGPGTDRGGPQPSPGASRSAGADEFVRDVTGAVKVAEEYWGAQLPARGVRFQPVARVVPYRDDGEISCGGEAIPRNNALYCPVGDFIAYDAAWAASAFEQIGDAFVYFLLGHEYAHAIQARLGIQPQFTITQELQADCAAGAYLGDSVRAGRLQLEPGDIQELQAGLLAVGDPPGQPWFSSGSHGTPQQRATSFFSGYNGGLAPCGM